jgi:hypothetical protein
MKNTTKKIKRIKLVPLPKLIKQTDKLVSEYVRKRDPFCVLCGSRERLQCSHLIRRGRMSTRFDVVHNCHTNCASCNYKHNIFPEFYTMWFIDKFGEEAYKNLIQRSLVIKKYTRTELYNIQIAIKILIERRTKNE